MRTREILPKHASLVFTLQWKRGKQRQRQLTLSKTTRKFFLSATCVVVPFLPILSCFYLFCPLCHVFTFFTHFVVFVLFSRFVWSCRESFESSFRILSMCLQSTLDFESHLSLIKTSATTLTVAGFQQKHNVVIWYLHRLAILNRKWPKISTTTKMSAVLFYCEQRNGWKSDYCIIPCLNQHSRCCCHHHYQRVVMTSFCEAIVPSPTSWPITPTHLSYRRLFFQQLLKVLLTFSITLAKFRCLAFCNDKQLGQLPLTQYPATGLPKRQIRFKFRYNTYLSQRLIQNMYLIWSKPNQMTFLHPVSMNKTCFWKWEQILRVK